MAKLKNVTMCKCLLVKAVCVIGVILLQKSVKKVAEKFASLKIKRTFALPFEKRVTVKVKSSYED